MGHLDPLDPNVGPPDRSTWNAAWQEAYDTPEMEAFREGLRLPGLPDVRSAVLDDLSSYFNIDAEECVYRSTHSPEIAEAAFVAENRPETSEEISRFYQGLQSWVFGLHWYAYLQAEGYACPVGVIIAHDLAGQKRGELLDFGSGAGSNALLFDQLGYTVSLADISSPLLDFARHRFERRQRSATFIDLKEQALPANTYDVVAAVQTMTSVPDAAATAVTLHRAMRPGGLFYADFDKRQRRVGDSRIHEDDLPLRRGVQKAGFVQLGRLGGVTFPYRRVEAKGLSHTYREVRDRVAFGAPRRYWRALRYNPKSPLAAHPR
jgi:SAM-dependent methyltransferase